MGNNNLRSQNNTIFVRYGIEKDIDTLVCFNIRMAQETENKALDQTIVRHGVQALFNDPLKGFYLIVEFNNEPVGQLMVTTEWSDWRNGNFWWIQSVFVIPDFREKGIYRTLHKEVRRLAKRKKDVCGIRLYVDETNETAQTVYHRLGMLKTNYNLFEEDWSDAIEN